MFDMTLKIGLTGGIGSGKSTVAKIFSTLGIPVFDADAAAKSIMVRDNDLQQKIIQLFGAEAYVNGSLNRKWIADKVFTDEFLLEKLNAIVHPAVIKVANDWMNNQQANYVIKEAALIFESGSGEGLDYVIGVFAPLSLKIQRVMQRDAVTREEVLKRMNRQVDDVIKRKLCDFVIENNEQTLLVPQILELHEKFLKLSSN